MPLEAVGSQLEEFRDSFDVPVRVASMHMSEVGGKLGDLPLHIEPGAVPVDECASGEPVPLMPISA